ncbi:metallophosphoesterase [Bacillus sp. SCS-153A]|uniref:metallophosphoesterase n=1 Tax=Rossellomorea sedimentorum TaxID=3115294 RepID=UPI0039067C89
MKKILKRTGMVAGIAIAALLIWGFIEPYIIDVEREEAVIPNLPQDWEGEEIAVIGDFQVGMWMDNNSVIPRIVDKIIEEDPKAVLILGDYVYHPADDRQLQMEKVADALRELSDADIPVFATLGNHDYAMAKPDDKINKEEADRVAGVLSSEGFTVLRNESVPLTLEDNEVVTTEENEDTLYLGALGASWPGNVDVSEALQDIPEEAPRLFMMHNPEAFSKLPANTAPVAVAGHTHGGQFRIPFTPDWSYKELFSKGESYADGWITESYGSGGNSLYVNRGIGLSLFPMRLNCPPEITILELSSQS